MKTNDYIKELKNLLSALDNKKREEIIKEIQSYIDESNIDYSLLIEKFGTPQELANSYLEDMPIKEIKNRKILPSLKQILLIIVAFLVVVFIVIGIFIYFMTKDSFNYSKFNATTIDSQVEEIWRNIDDVDSLEIEQAKVVIYWSDKSSFQVSCRGSKNEQIKNSFVIKQSKCFLKVPKQKLDIKSIQSEIVIVEPKENVEFDSKQSRIRVASEKTPYKYELKGEESDFEKIKSNKNGILIKGKFYQSEVIPYEY